MKKFFEILVKIPVLGSSELKKGLSQNKCLSVCYKLTREKTNPSIFIKLATNIAWPLQINSDSGMQWEGWLVILIPLTIMKFLS